MKMSSAIHSDAPMIQSNGTQQTHFRRTSSARPNGPPTDSNAPLSDYGFADDQIPNNIRRPKRKDRLVPKVEDTIGQYVQINFEEFLESFVEEPSSSATSTSDSAVTDKYYVSQIHGLKTYNLSTLYINFKHLFKFRGGALAEGIVEEYYRFLPFLIKGLHNIIAKYEPRYFREHRQPVSSTNMTNSSAASNAATASQSDFQGNLTTNQQTDKLFTLAFYNLALVSRIRHLRTANIGQLVSVSGTVTRTSEVRPELLYATFTCEACRSTVLNVEQIFRYMEPNQCPNESCGNRQAWSLDIRQSIFSDWQKVRVQENSAEIPTGSMPRTIDVILRGEVVDRAKAGERCIFTGTLIVVPDVSQLGLPGVRPMAVRDNQNRSVDGSGVTGLKNLGVRDLTYKLVFLACMVVPDISTTGSGANSNASSQSASILASLSQGNPLDPYEVGDVAQEAVLASMTHGEIEDLRQMVHSDHIYSRLVNSLAPMIYGHEIIKKGLLLQLMGGLSKKTEEGMALRGDINICIVGDPSTSKSQFLKYICSFLPRAIYTSGKASSAAGLTAAVVKDEETGEFTIEAGALMLADNGICAIDEFDKMDIGDQVAIHEAMEQQTISIAKAGIQATLNARTSILAAANPVGGRYNRKATLRANINMSAPIMSRFDLFFIILDECNETIDKHLAQHIVSIHQLRDDAVQPEFTTEQLQRYIRFARTFKPEFTEQAKVVLVEKYKELRSDDAQGGIGRNSYRITVRQLESMIRLSEAIARANCVEDITPNMVIEAFNLLQQSIISVEKDDIEVEEEEDEESKFEKTQVDTQGRDLNDNSLMKKATDAKNQAFKSDLEVNETLAVREEASREKQKTKITYDKYISVVNLLVRKVQEDEIKNTEGIDSEQLIQWYLEQKENELSGEEDYHTEMALTRKILKRMVKENILISIRGQGLVGDSNENNANSSDRVVYVLHPNCAVGDL